MTGGSFEGCDKPRGESEFQARASSVVVVTPTKDTEPINYVTQIKNLNKMCKFSSLLSCSSQTND